MKEQYVEPAAEPTLFFSEDIISSSQDDVTEWD